MGIYFQETTKMALRTLYANKLRSSLTMLGIVIGNAAVVTMVSVGLGTQRYITRELEALGTNSLFIFPGVNRGSGGSFFEATTLSLRDAEAIEQSVADLVAIAPERSQRYYVTHKTKQTQVRVTGTSNDYPIVRNAPIAIGDFFGLLDVRKNNRVAVLGSDTARKLFGERNPVGAKIRINNRSFNVVGVMSPKGSTSGRNQDEVIFVPISTAIDQLMGRDLQTSSPKIDTITVSAIDASTSETVQYQITNLLRLLHDGKEDFTVRNQQDLLQSANNITNVLVLMLGATAAVSLLVGGIGIMNIMLVSVTERTREIGLRKAIGASASDIMIQFTIEAIILSTAGGIIGIGFGVGGTFLVSLFSPIEAILSPVAIVVAFSISGAIGLGFSIYPARSAALLDPIVALRTA